MQALAQRCRDAGISFMQGQVNKLVIEDKDVGGAETKDGRVVRASRRVVLAAGSWSPAIFPELSDKLTATGQVLATVQLDASEASKWKNIPVYIDMETGFYMFPPTDDNQIKIAFHLRGYTNDQPSLSDEEKKVSVPRTGHFVGELDENIPKRSVEQLREALRRVWPELADKPFSGTRMCWYCDSKDCDFLVGYSARHPSLFLATGDSGHAYKFLPVIGQSATFTGIGMSSIDFGGHRRSLCTIDERDIAVSHCGSLVAAARKKRSSARSRDVRSYGIGYYRARVNRRSTSSASLSYAEARASQSSPFEIHGFGEGGDVEGPFHSCIGVPHEWMSPVSSERPGLGQFR
jgi:hypothetical protein